MLRIDLNQEAVGASERLSRSVVKAVEEALNSRVPDVPKGTVAARMISDEEMTDLNARYRNKHKTTDVLSFSYLEDPDMETLGDVVISHEQARRQAENGLEHEVVLLLVHGVLHVLGYDHEDVEDEHVMFPLQKAVVDDAI